MIDTHLHLWNPDLFDYPWLAGISSLNREHGLAEYRQACGSTPIDSSLFVECNAGPDSTLKEARWALDLASNPENKIAGVVASIWPERENFLEDLNALSGHPQLKGIRRVLHTEPDELSRSTQFRKNLQRLTGPDLSFELCLLERQLPVGIELVDACPDVRFVLDHCGVPDIAAGSPGGWREQITAFASRPNVVCKISGILLYAGEGGSAASVFPWFSHVIESFGWERVVWGGDWPVCNLGVSLGKWIGATDELLEMISATPAQRSGFLDSNAKRIYKL